MAGQSSSGPASCGVLEVSGCGNVLRLLSELCRAGLALSLLKCLKKTILLFLSVPSLSLLTFPELTPFWWLLGVNLVTVLHSLPFFQPNDEASHLAEPRCGYVTFWATDVWAEAFYIAPFSPLWETVCALPCLSSLCFCHWTPVNGSRSWKVLGLIGERIQWWTQET
jgi:hypothetical protein